MNNPLAHLSFRFDENSGIFYSAWQYIKRSYSLRQLPDKTVGLYTIVGANMSIRRAIFELISGFAPDLRSAEEDDFWNRLRRLQPNAKLLYEPTAIVKHDYDPQFKDALRRNRSYGAGLAHLFLKSEGLRVPTLYPFPFLVLLSLGLMLLSPYLLLVSFLLVILLYPGWLIEAIRKNRPQYTLYSFVQISLELVNDYGFVTGYIKLRHTVDHDRDKG